MSTFITADQMTLKQANGLLDHIGHTPLVEIKHLTPPGVRLLAKLEASNPGGSIKDRPVSRMMIKAAEAGIFDGGRRLLDSSSGNAGIAYAMVGASLGIPVTIVIPGNASRERMQRIRSHGAELIITDPLQGYDFALREAQRLAREQADVYWHCDQYSNENNWLAHYHGTAEEIIQQLKACAITVPDAFVAGVGTGGTLTGIGRRLSELNPDIHIASVIPEIFPGIEGLKPLGEPDDIVPNILDQGLIDQRIPVTLDQALQGCQQLAKQGLFVGPSSGAYVQAAVQLAETKDFSNIVTILSDNGERYHSTGMWQMTGPGNGPGNGSGAGPGNGSGDEH